MKQGFAFIKTVVKAKLGNWISIVFPQDHMGRDFVADVIVRKPD